MVSLSICIPTRNRQGYCIETMRAIAGSGERDFEVIVADNSDDPAPLRQAFDSFSDHRFRLVAPQGRVLSMVDNWERLIPETAGHWISVIGDDDYIDPAVGGLIRRFEGLRPDVEAIGWGRMNFHWPDNRPVPTLASVPTGAGCWASDRVDLQDRLFRWSEGRSRPSCGFGIYHGAVRRTLMERIRQTYGGRYFEHPVVDYDSNCKVVAEARSLLYCERPFSVLGECAASNSASALSLERLKVLVETFKTESASDLIRANPDFPFTLFEAGASLCVSIAATTVWFCRKYGIDLTGFEANFARAAMDECRYSPSLEAYEAKVANIRAGFAAWDGGRWADLFEPAPFNAPKTVNALSGVMEDMIHLREDRLRVTTPGEFYRYAEHAIMPVGHVVAGTRSFVT
ncbi:glycosyltransferase family A protein [Hoeflea marina]|nr:glycosyltransferase family A protein [Hoeflea marina]